VTEQGILPNPNLRSVKVYRVPIPISVNHLYGVTSSGQRYIKPEGKAWVTEATLALRAQGFRVEPADRYCVGFHVYFPDRRRADLDNCLKQLCDLVSREAGIDDSRIWSLMVEKGISKDAPRVELKISPYAYTG
jgi:Holliday junction resolvase RusA-like endonuclease